LGWKTNNQAMRISIGRQGRWYRWAIEKSVGTRDIPVKENDLSFVNRVPVYLIVDRGEAPELPSGLRRFWHTDPAKQLDGPTTLLPEEKEKLTPDSNPKITD
jgi:hypothetical protein